MSDLNSISMVGRISNEPELKVNGNGTSALIFNIANNRIYKHNEETVDEVSFFRVKLWGKQAENLKEYLVKGKQIGINGRLHQYKFSSPDGNHINITEIIASTIHLLNDAKNKKAHSKAIPESVEEVN